jgi:predicted DNA-binding transcriptional regulator AlpA
MSETIPLEPLLSTEEAAQILDVSPSWLAKARMRGDGPEYVQIGRAIRYSRTSLLRFMAERTRKTTNKRKSHKKKGGATD